MTKRTFSLFAGLALLGCAGLSSRATERELRVMTWNIHAGTDAHGAPSLDRIGAAIRAAEPDILLLQEVDSATRRSNGVDQLAVLAASTGMQGVFGRSLDYQGGGYGIAILSRHPIVGRQTIRLRVEPPQERAGGAYEPRSALVARIRVGGDTIEVVNTHIDASRDDFYRLQEIRTVLAIAGERRGSVGVAAARPAGAAAGRAVILGGDLNSEPESEVQRLVRDTGWRDAWTNCGGGGPGLSYPDSASRKRIDYLYLGPEWRCRGARVVPNGASDHAPVIVELQR
ncbi:MAG TPA: endonuclease/exonuclease/phosphatase family protein [Gemmatimonadaceae bacterium]|nr:endonuclease/exonuclease/phosphatase family protein [Gemmatimonadaceae bacterium]